MNQSEFDEVLQGLVGRPCMVTQTPHASYCEGPIHILINKTRIHTHPRKGVFVFCRVHAEIMLNSRIAWETSQIDPEGTAILPIEGLTMGIVHDAQEKLEPEPTNPMPAGGFFLLTRIWPKPKHKPISLSFRVPFEYMGTVVPRILNSAKYKNTEFSKDWIDLGKDLYSARCHVDDQTLGIFTFVFDGGDQIPAIRHIIKKAKKGVYGPEVMVFANHLLEICPPSE